jgi:hypothetical protein
MVGTPGRRFTMTITTEHAQTSTMTTSDARERIAALLAEAGLSRREMHRRALAFDLDARCRGILAEIEGLEWLIRRADATPR